VTFLLTDDADLPAEFPPIGTVAGRTGNLPLQVSSFIGRARELEQIAGALGEARLVTLTGAGGVGKTRLALQAAEEVAARSVTVLGGVNWRRCATPPEWTTRLRQCSQSSPRPARAPGRLWWSSYVVSSFCWCWTTVSIWSKRRRRWLGYCSGPVSGW
jgi:hypothetical protein